MTEGRLNLNLLYRTFILIGRIIAIIIISIIPNLLGWWSLNYPSRKFDIEIKRTEYQSLIIAQFIALITI